MSEQSTTDPQTGLDKIFAALRGIGVQRRTDDKWIGGVCSGLADRLGVDPVIVRAALVVLSILGGIGVSVYLVAWALLPNDKDEIAAERALRDGHGGSIVLLVLAAFAVFGGSWWGSDAGWGFPWGLVAVGLLIWWAVQQTRNHPDADRRVTAHQQQAGTTFAAASSPTTVHPSPSGPRPGYGGPVATAPRPIAIKRLRRRSGGPLMALLAIGLTFVTLGSLNWLGSENAWAGNHAAIALAGALGAVGLLLVGLGVAGLRAGFVGFLTIVLAISALSAAVVPSSIHINGRFGDATWAPNAAPVDPSYRIAAGTGVLDLTGLPKDGLTEARIPVSVGLGELRVIVPEGLTVKVNGHVGLGDVTLPDRSSKDGDDGTDVTVHEVFGTGPTEVVVDAEIGIGSLTVEKE